VINGGSGAFAEIALANEESIAHKPKRLSNLEAAAFPLVGVVRGGHLGMTLDYQKVKKF